MDVSVHGIRCRASGSEPPFARRRYGGQYPNMAETTAHSRSAAEVLEVLGSSDDGLDADSARERLAAYGPNKLPEKRPRPAVLRFFAHFNNVLIYILIAAGVLKAILNEWVDCAVIVSVAVVNAAVGFIQEGRAQRALDSIRGMLSVTAQVRRDGHWQQVDAQTLVPGDIVRISSGDRIPADMRLLAVANLRVEESALTGESLPAKKDVAEVGADAGLGDRMSMVYSGTIVAAGSATGVVTATGTHTEIGRIQSLIADVETVDTPLTRKLARFGRQLSVGILGAAAVMLVIGKLVHQFTVSELITAAIGFAVAAIPEGLPAVVTITLALGVQQMARRRAITRKLPAVEALGAVNVIYSDKTGTLTQNEVTARTVVTARHRFDVTGTGYRPEGGIELDGTPITPADYPDLTALLTTMAVCNDARLDEADGHWRVVGEPTEGALRTLTLKAQIDDAAWPRLGVVPFESANKFMVTLNDTPGGQRCLYVTGAPDRLLDRSATQADASSPASLDRSAWEARIDELSGQGLRVLAAARQPAAGAGTVDIGDIGGGLEFLGIVGIVDPPRPEAITAIESCHTAGIQVTMITGDHAGTAQAIAGEMGIIKAGSAPRVVTGAELEEMSQTRLRQVADEVDVFARTSPEHKLRIVSALQAQGKVVAMTGVLADDNFATIERAVEEGRRIYDNIRKSVLFMLPTNGAQSLIILVAILAGFALPLQPVQILWVNMVTSVTLSLALVFEKAEDGLMQRPPRTPRQSLVNGADVAMISLVSVLIAGATLAEFFVARAGGYPLAVAQTAAVNMLALGQLAYLLNCRFVTSPSLRPQVFGGNPWVWRMAGAMIALQLVFTYAPFMHTWFHSAPITIRGWSVAVALSIVVFLTVEMAKWVGRRFMPELVT